MVKAQEWLDRDYPKEQRKNIKKLKINEMDLEGELEWQKRDMMFWLTGDKKHLKNLENLIEVSPNSQD